MASYLPNQLYQMPLAELQPDPAQPRKYMDPVALDEGIGTTASKIDDIDFPSFTAEDRAMLIESMNAMKDILESAITRAVKNRKMAT